VLVSKLKPASDILALHAAAPPAAPDAAPRPRAEHFGENYAQELQAKAAALPRTVKWHFVGGLQANKARALAAGVPNLWCVSGVDSARKADLLDRGRAAAVEARARERGEGRGAEEDEDEGERRLRVKIQVNTSGEAQKAGVAPADAPALARHVVERCPHLRLAGLMTVGAVARSADGAENEDFRALARARDDVAAALGVPAAGLELSMGMSADFEAAVAMGSDEVRVGSSIFGERPPRRAAETA
jgi:pyridoxal phosphate enzyme (YggS family)